jgi:hypothetical protein
MRLSLLVPKKERYVRIEVKYQYQDMSIFLFDLKNNPL